MRILVVDDEAAVRDALSRLLRFEGYEVCLAADGASGLAEVRDRKPDAVILDVAMPGQDGLSVCRALRGDGNLVPVLMLTARESVGDRVAGLDAGADDYLVKPFASQELLARIRALLRRSVSAGSDVARDAGPWLRFEDMSLHPLTREVRRGSRDIQLTRTEFAILEVFLRHPRQVLTRALLLEHVWGYDFGVASNSLDVYIGYLRRKLEYEGEPRLLQTVRGVGYALRSGTS
ncbi:response regulator transcription factor [Micromonospora sp. RHAY321]|uniref:response regulator transcription factor n=1 Tax=Micromonospora sp. RHAY321 TaxID=2944807 RepID=UPI00207CF3FA|nr:response regulator transcription factor [Micromonospora sp. RHAY321]MCO1593891.1 response regulator transcription factor [Micromonospora sp. RHAY321]